MNVRVVNIDNQLYVSEYNQYPGFTYVKRYEVEH